MWVAYFRVNRMHAMNKIYINDREKKSVAAPEQSGCGDDNRCRCRWWRTQTPTTATSCVVHKKWASARHFRHLMRRIICNLYDNQPKYHRDYVFIRTYTYLCMLLRWRYMLLRIRMQVSYWCSTHTHTLLHFISNMFVCDWESKSFCQMWMAWRIKMKMKEKTVTRK